MAVSRRWLIVVLLLSLGVNIGIFSTLALRRWAPPGERQATPVRGLEDLTNRLRLRGEKREEFVAVQEKLVRRAQENVRSYQQAQRQLQREIARRRPDRLRIEGIIARIEELHGERHRMVVRAMLQSRKVLDRRQQRIYRQFLGRLGRQAPGGRPNRNHRRPPP